MIDVVGEALVDAHVEGWIIRGHPDGNPFNTALALARLGIPAAFRSPLSTDAFGDLLGDALSRNGVMTYETPRIAAPTPLALVAHAAAGAAQCERASAWGPTINDVERLLTEHVLRSVETAKGG